MAGKGGRGRSRKTGTRHKCGKLATGHDYGNDRAQAHRVLFAIFQGGKADQQVHDPIGRAWAVGLLDGNDVDGAAIRDAGREYAARYWTHYPNPERVANYEGEDRRGEPGGSYLDPDPRGERFMALDDALLSAGRPAYDAMRSMCLDHYHFPDEHPAWLDRLINERRVKAGLAVAGYLPKPGDTECLRLAVTALLAIVAGTKKRRAA